MQRAPLGLFSTVPHPFQANTTPEYTPTHAHFKLGNPLTLSIPVKYENLWAALERKKKSCFYVVSSIILLFSFIVEEKIEKGASILGFFFFLKTRKAKKYESFDQIQWSKSEMIQFCNHRNFYDFSTTLQRGWKKIR